MLESGEECHSLLSCEHETTLHTSLSQSDLYPSLKAQSFTSAPAHISPKEADTVDLLFQCSNVKFQSPFTATGGEQGFLKLTRTNVEYGSIDIRLEWSAEQSDYPLNQFEHGSYDVVQSLFDLLTMRLRLKPSPASVTFFLAGGKRLGTFVFLGGVKDVIQFVAVLREYVNTTTLRDKFCQGELFLLEQKPFSNNTGFLECMDRVANEAEADDFSSLLRDCCSEHCREKHAKKTTISKGKRKLFRKKKRSGYGWLSQEQKIAHVQTEEFRQICKPWPGEGGLGRQCSPPSRYDREKGSCGSEFAYEQRKRIGLSLRSWEAELDENGMIRDPAVIKLAIHVGGLVGDTCRRIVWPYLLGYYPWDSSRLQRLRIDACEERRYKLLRSKWAQLHAAATTAADKAKPVEVDLSDRKKRLSDRMRKSYADCLGAATQIRKDVVRMDRHLDIYAQDDSPATRTMERVLNVYAFYNRRIGYSQGMSDFASVMIYVLGVSEEAKVFWCFVKLMERVEGNFDMTQSNLRYELSQLRRLVQAADPELSAFITQADAHWLFFFRWMFVLFKRELPLYSTLRLWEALWTTNQDSNDFHIYIAAGILLLHRKEIFSIPAGASDSMLRWVNDLTLRINVSEAVREGELLRRRHGATLR